jgi:Kef-type K+ transport system membrane component KefB/Trk K+ transport system NAD-binding subunit
VEHNPFTALLLITALALAVPITANRFRRFRLPIVVGEIFAGIVIGKSGFNLIEPSPTLDFLSEFGFAYLMFLSGLEVDFSLLVPDTKTSQNKRAFSQPMPMAVLVLVGTLVLAFAASQGLTFAGVAQNPILLSLILSTTSLGIVVPVLKERSLLASKFGQYLLAASSIADFGTLLLVTVAIAVRSHGLTLDLLLIPVLLIIFILTARASRRFRSLAILQRMLNELSSATAQIRVRGAFALMTAWVVLAEALGVELILGAFLAGAIASLVNDKGDSDAQEKLDAIGYGFFIPIFFIMVGVNFNLQALVESPRALILVPLLIVIAFVVKVLPSLLLRLEFSWRESIAGGFLLSSRLSLIIAASAIALDIGAISEAVNAAIILLAVLTCTISPLAFNRLLPMVEEERREGVIIIGKDQMAEMLTERMIIVGEAVTIICPDESRLEAFARLNVPVITGCARLEDAFHQAGGHRVRSLVDLTSSPEETLEVCTVAKQLFEIPIVVSRISDVELFPELQELGVKIVQPALATAMALEGAMRYPTAFDVLLHKTTDVDVGEVGMTNRSFEGVPLGTIRLPGDVLILSVNREDTVIVPNPDTVLRRGDRLGLIGSPDALEESIAMLRG